MKKLVIVYVVLIVAVVLLAIVKAGGNFNLPIPNLFGGGAQAEIGKNKLNLVVVKKQEDLQKGLSGRKTIPDNQGMLFLFDKKDYYPFWMKGMLFSIDIIYIDDNKVVYIVENAPSSTQVPNLIHYKPDQPANRVLEVKAGIAKKLGISRGTTINFKNVK